MFRLRFALGTALGVGLVAFNLAACSSSGSAKASAAGNGSPSTQATTSNGSTAATNATLPPAEENGSASAASAAAAAAASGDGEPLAPIGCGGITPAMVNDLVTTPITSITYPTSGIYPDHHFDCDAGMRIDVFPQDSDKAQYTSDLAAENAAPNPISGVGDVAVYTLATLAGMPDIYAHKGTVTCEVKPSSTVTDYKVAIEPSSAFGGMITKDAGAAWATKAAGLCTAIFAALKA